MWFRAAPNLLNKISATGLYLADIVQMAPLEGRLHCDGHWMLTRMIRLFAETRTAGSNLVQALKMALARRQIARTGSLRPRQPTSMAPNHVPS